MQAALATIAVLPVEKSWSLWTALELHRRHGDSIPRILSGGWIKLEQAGHELARREDRHEEYKADGPTGKLEFLIRWAMGKYGISRNDCFGMRVEDFLEKIAQIDPPEKNHSGNPPSGDDVAHSDDLMLDLLSSWSGRQSQARRIVEFLWSYNRLVGWDVLPKEAFQGNGRPTDEAILKALKRIKTKLSAVFERLGVDLEIHESERRVRLIKPSDKPDR